MGQPCASWLQQVDQHLEEMGMGQASAWEMARRRPWSTDGKWMKRRAAPILDLTRLLDHNCEVSRQSMMRFKRRIKKEDCHAMKYGCQTM